MSGFALMLRRDLRLAIRSRSEAAMPLLFFAVLLAIFPLALDPEPALQRALAPAGLWIAALVSHLLSLERLWRDDLEDGFIEQMLLSPLSPVGLILGKVTAHWLVSGLPLVLIAPLFLNAMHVEGQASAMGSLALLLGTPVLSLVGGIIVALTLALPRGGMMLGLLALPMYVPVLVFGAGIMQAAMLGLPVAGQLYLLCALLVLALTLAPLAMQVALRLGVDS